MPHPAGIPLHHGQIRAHGLSQVALIHHQQIAARDTGPALARHLIPARDINHIDDEIGQLARVVGRQVIAAGLDEEQIRAGGRVGGAVQRLERLQVGGDVLAHGGVRAAAGFDGADARRGEGVVPVQELGVLAGEDVVGHGREGVGVAQGGQEGEEEGGLAGTDGAV